jgi:hypothetical protein
MSLILPPYRDPVTGTRGQGIPGNKVTTAPAGIAADVIRYSVFTCEDNYDITDILGTVTTAPASATTLGIALYEGNADWSIGRLIHSQLFSIPAATGSFSVSNLSIKLTKGSGSGIYYVAVNAGLSMSIQCYNTIGVPGLDNGSITQISNRYETGAVTMASIVAAGGFAQQAVAPTAHIRGTEGPRHPCIFKYNQ